MTQIRTNSLSLELTKGSKKHNDILDRLWERYQMSRRAMSERYPSWTKMEEAFRAYMPASDVDNVRKAAREAGRPQYTTLVIPYDYAVLMTAHTYYTSVFLSRDPVFQFQGRHGESQTNEQAVEALVAYQTNRSDNLVALYNWLLDPGKYGVGIVGWYWDEEYVTSSQIVLEDAMAFGQPIAGKKRRVRRTQTVPGYHGNKLYNIRPADWYPDPRVSTARFQEGEFVGRYVEISMADAMEQEEQGFYFNIQAAKDSYKMAGMRERGSTQNLLPNALYYDRLLHSVMKDGKDGPGVLPAIEMYVRLSPRDWGLGTSRTREMWMFTFDSDTVIQAAPVGLLSNKFPQAVMEYEPGSYYLTNRSLMEIMKPLSDTMSWLINTHFYNVRKTLNGEYLVDPSKVQMSDFDNPNPGRAIRLRPAAYGTPLSEVLFPLQVGNVTGTHIQDAQLVADMLQRTSGVVDNVMGMVNSGGRKTATEVRTSSSFSVNRLKTNCEYFSAMGFMPLSEGLLSTSQQMYDIERKYRIVGDLLKPGGERFINVAPEDIMGCYDFVPVDGTMPIDRFAMATMWQQLLAGLRNFPQVAGQYDITKILAYVAGLTGIKNIDRFKIQVADPSQLSNQVQAGNVVPIGGGRVSTQLPGVGSAG